jgi:chromosome partitioning protein
MATSARQAALPSYLNSKVNDRLAPAFSTEIRDIAAFAPIGVNLKLGTICDPPIIRNCSFDAFSGELTLRVLALASQKGGSGKTTLSGHLAVQAQRAGAGPVVLIDIDPQGSLADWWNEREAELPAFAQTTVARLAADLAVLRQQGFRLAVIDTPPAITMAIQSVISVSELIVVPTRPSANAPASR